MLDEGDKAIIKDISYGAAEHTVQRVQGSFDSKIEALQSSINAKLVIHQASCPHGNTVSEAKDRVRGAWWTICILATVISAIATIAIELFRKGKP
jgi:hypothetical protein